VFLDNLIIYLYEYSTRFKNRNSALNHIHFDQLHSTQTYLLEQYSVLSGNVLVSCDDQLSGRGQYSRSWDSQQGGIYLSFLIEQNPTITLSSLEMGVLIVNFFKEYYKIPLRLKWPNDILTESNKKCAGILINNPGGPKLVVGIGINLFSSTDNKDYKTPIGHILDSALPITQKGLSLRIYNYILDNRQSPDQVTVLWNKYCSHLNRVVQFKDAQQDFSGVFKGIGPMGEALIEQNNTITKFYTGSLSL
jgi:BirA family biotin operon repressor/biotin-[acetyl-CoA-carboxylase] ligase